MFVNEQLVFLHLQKAAGTYVADRLSQQLPGIVRDGHAPLWEGKRGRVVAAAIRDPWEWYVSLWAYGCMGEGGVRGHLTAPRGQAMGRALRAALTGELRTGEVLAHLRRESSRDPAFWRDLYTSAEDTERFRGWLRAFLTLPGAGHLPEGYQDLPMCGHVGFMTFRVLRLFTDWTAWQDGSNWIRTPDEALTFYRRHCIVDHVLRTEKIATDLDRLLATLGAKKAIGKPAGPVKDNRSRRSRHVDYYNAETVTLVHEKDRMVIETFGYAPPSLVR